MKAGFAREKVTPPLGTRMIGFAVRDREGPCTAIHDDLYARALYLNHGRAEALLVALDICMMRRADADRFKGALGAALGLAPRQILLSMSHTHVGPCVGSWAWAQFLPADELYLQELEAALLRAAEQAKKSARNVNVHAGLGRTTIPMNRRRPTGDGKVAWAPHPQGVTCDLLPVTLFRDGRGRPVALVFSASCHPSTAGGHEISAEYPGVACCALDDYLGAEVSMFLQGTGGDAKPALSASPARDKWLSNDWNIVAAVGRTLAREVVAVIEQGLKRVRPVLRSALVEMKLPLAAPLSREELEALARALTLLREQGIC